MEGNDPRVPGIESWSLLGESRARSRTQGRMPGWLLAGSPPRQFSRQLSDALGVGAASVSTITRRPVGIGLLRRGMESNADGERLAGESLDLLGAAPPERRRRLHEMHDLWGFVAGGMAEAADAGESRKKGEA